MYASQQTLYRCGIDSSLFQIFRLLFSEEDLTADRCSWEDTVSKLWNTHFPNRNNKLWRCHDIIILKKTLFQPGNTECCNWNKNLIQILKCNVGFCLLSSRAFDIISRNFDGPTTSFEWWRCHDTRIFDFLLIFLSFF